MSSQHISSDPVDEAAALDGISSDPVGRLQTQKTLKIKSQLPPPVEMKWETPVEEMQDDTPVEMQGKGVQKRRRTKRAAPKRRKSHRRKHRKSRR